VKTPLNPPLKLGGSEVIAKCDLFTLKIHMEEHTSIVLIGKIEQSILLIRRQKVIIDADLANFYGVETRIINQQVKRNPHKFPEDFIFQLTDKEKNEVITKCDNLSKLKYTNVLPYAFTEHGAIMAASVLNSPRAVEMSVFIVRAFVKMRQMIMEHQELALKIAEIEKHLTSHDQQILTLFKALKESIGGKEVAENKRIGFRA